MKNKKGILLDIGCGANKREGFVGIDKQKLAGVDIVHDLEVFPYPIDRESCHIIVASHIVEHIKPWLTIDLFNELWRIMKPSGQLIISTPYAGSSIFWQDPTHCNGFNENTFLYFMKSHPYWNFYKPKPWKMENGFPVWQNEGVLEVVMRKDHE